jgi:hypothetical protein
MIKPSRGHRNSLMIAVPFLVSLARVCSAADETHAIYPPLQIFKEFCLDAEWSLGFGGWKDRRNFADAPSRSELRCAVRNETQESAEGRIAEQLTDFDLPVKSHCLHGIIQESGVIRTGN